MAYFSGIKVYHKRELWEVDDSSRYLVGQHVRRDDGRPMRVLKIGDPTHIQVIEWNQEDSKEADVPPPLTQRERYQQARTQPLIRKFEAMLKEMEPSYSRDSLVHGHLNEMIIHESQREPDQPGAAEDILLVLVRQLLEFRAQAISDEIARQHDRTTFDVLPMMYSFPEWPKDWYRSQREQMKAGYKESMQAHPKSEPDGLTEHQLRERLRKYMDGQIERFFLGVDPAAAGADRTVTAAVKGVSKDVWEICNRFNAKDSTVSAQTVESAKMATVPALTKAMRGGYRYDPTDAVPTNPVPMTRDPVLSEIAEANGGLIPALPDAEVWTGVDQELATATREGYPHESKDLVPHTPTKHPGVKIGMSWPTPPDPDATPPPDAPKEVPSLCKLRHHFIDGVCSRCGQKEWA